MLDYGIELAIKQHMINAISVINDTVLNARTNKRLTAGEMLMLLNVFRDMPLTATIDKHTLDLRIRDNAELYPEQWAGVDKDSLLEKIDKFTDWEAACFQIWAVDFWQVCNTDTEAMQDYVSGKNNVLLQLTRACSTVKDAREFCERFKRTGVKSKLIAQAQEKCGKAVEMLERMIL